MALLEPETLVARQIAAARRRMLLEQFLQLVPWCCTVTFGIALAATAIPKLFLSSFDPLLWPVAWLVGGLLSGCIAAGLWTWWRATSPLEAAVEIDRRFQLRERVSSLLALSPEERESEAGQALLADAVRRASALDVKSEFGLRLGRRAWWPFVPVAGALALAFLVPDREQPPIAAAENIPAATKEQIERSTEDLRKKLAERRKEAQAKGLEEAAELFDKLEQATQEIKQKSDVKREEALSKLNDLAKTLAERRDKLAGSEQVQKQLNELKNLQQGPADKVADAMRNGDLAQAREELEKLGQQLKDGKLDEQAQEKLAEQMQQMQQKLQQAADAHQQSIQDAQQKLQQAQAQGDAARAQQIEKELEQLQQQVQRMQQLNDLAQQLRDAQQQLRDGDRSQAAQSLDKMAQQLSQMQQENEELESLDEALNQIADAKQQMNCQHCGGKGCEHCQSQGQGQQAGGDKPGANGQAPGGQQAGQGGKDGRHSKPGDQTGPGIGVGRGPGDGPESEIDGKFFDTRVRQKVGVGAGTIVDRVDGPNIRGQVRQEVQQGLSAAGREESDPLTGTRLPKAQRDHAREYFDAFRDQSTE